MAKDDYEEGTELVQIQGQTFTFAPGEAGDPPETFTVDMSRVPFVPDRLHRVDTNGQTRYPGENWSPSGLKDGGSRKTYSTGAQKEDSSKTEGKGAYHLLPTYPIRRLAEIYRKGAQKYSSRNWEKGIPLSRFLDSAKRHLDKYAEGMMDEEHDAQAFWNIAGLIHTAEMIRRGLLPAELDDLPSYGVDGVAVEVEKGVFCDKWRKQGKGCENK